jgi:hypothetical protein
LRRLGAISPVGSLQVLPAQEMCIESFQWLAQEIRDDQGEALVFFVEQFEGLTTQQVIALFCAARKKDYEDINAAVEKLETTITDAEIAETEPPIRSTLNQLRKQFRDVKAIDYFNCPEGVQLEKRIEQLERMMHHNGEAAGDVTRVSLEEYKGKRWVTRPRPHVDRLASIWLIHQFVDPQAIIRYGLTAEAGEIAFDMQDAHFTHHGTFCTFETMMHAFQLHSDGGLQAIAEIVHEIDLRDGYYQRAETAGVDAILQGWLLANFSDSELEQHGAALFAALYATFSYQNSAIQGE